MSLHVGGRSSAVLTVYDDEWYGRDYEWMSKIEQQL